MILFPGYYLEVLGFDEGELFLHGKHLGIGFRPSISSKGGDGICRIGATCVKRKRKLAII